MIEWYRPGAIVLQCGADSLAGDRLGCFNLSHKGHANCVDFVRRFNIPLMILGGGGYTIRNVARCWAYETARLVDVTLPEELPFNDYFEYYGPDHGISVPSSNMANQNSREYLERLRERIVETLRSKTAAPGVQMHSVPYDLFTGNDNLDEDSEQDDGDEFDELRQLDTIKQHRPSLLSSHKPNDAHKDLHAHSEQLDLVS